MPIGEKVGSICMKNIYGRWFLLFPFFLPFYLGGMGLSIVCDCGVPMRCLNVFYNLVNVLAYDIHP